MLSALKWKTLESRRTIARLSMLYKMRNRLVFFEDIKPQPVDHLYSTRSKEYAYKQPITTRMKHTLKGNCTMSKEFSFYWFGNHIWKIWTKLITNNGFKTHLTNFARGPVPQSYRGRGTPTNPNKPLFSNPCFIVWLLASALYKITINK